VSRSDEEVLRFIAASFPSVWALEVLLALRSERRPWNRAELLTALRASELVVSRALEGLVAGGMALSDDEGVRYQPASNEIDECAERTEQMYRSHPNVVRRAIVSAGMSGATAFADAFKLRKGRDD